MENSGQRRLRTTPSNWMSKVNSLCEDNHVLVNGCDSEGKGMDNPLPTVSIKPLQLAKSGRGKRYSVEIVHAGCQYFHLNAMSFRPFSTFSTCRCTFSNRVNLHVSLSRWLKSPASVTNSFPHCFEFGQWYTFCLCAGEFRWAVRDPLSFH